MRLLLYPDGEHRYIRKGLSAICPYIELLGVQTTADPLDSFDVVMYQSYHKSIRKHDSVITKLSTKYDIINIGCEDIRKSKNEEMMMRTFGYNSLATGRDKQILEKSEEQGRHDMKTVSRIGNREGYLYVKLLNNMISETTVRDYRIFIFDYKIKAIMTKDKPLHDRFAGAINADVRWHENYMSLISKKEAGNIEKYCRAYRTHYTELDAIRDADGMLYIVDNNNVPSYNPAMRLIFEAGDKKYLRYLADCFYEMLKKHRS